MSAEEAFTRRPAWEIDALVQAWNDEQRQAKSKAQGF